MHLIVQIIASARPININSIWKRNKMVVCLFNVEKAIYR